MVTMKDIAKIAGVSHSTVSRALNNDPRISPETTAKVRRIASEYGYSLDIRGRVLAKGQTFTIGLAIPNITDEFFLPIIRGVEHQASEYGYSLVLCSTRGDTRFELEAIRLMSERRVGGLIIAWTDDFFEIVHKLHPQESPVVFIGNVTGDSPYPSIDCDHRSGAYDATKHLAELGHKHITFLSGPLSSIDSRERLRGYTQAIHEYKLVTDVWEGDYARASGYMQGRKILSKTQRPSAIFAANDWMAMGVMAAAKELGMLVPEELSVVGFDDVSPARHLLVPLTTVRQPAQEMGKIAVKMLLKQSENDQLHRRIVLPTKLVVRKTTGPARDTN
ncbi:MAG: LacI family transcriptional regulator [Firmicutes bacterium]|nr:LacI family transcriptional regulator [Bacillota bacterium]